MTDYIDANGNVLVKDGRLTPRAWAIQDALSDETEDFIRSILGLSDEEFESLDETSRICELRGEILSHLERFVKAIGIRKPMDFYPYLPE